MKASKGKTPYRAQFLQVDVQPLGPGQLQFVCILANAGGVAWVEHASPPGAGAQDVAPAVGPVRLGYQVFDAETGALVLDGERTSLGGPCDPGQTRRLQTQIQLPPEEGRYRVIISPVQEQVAWFYERGSQYVEIEVSATADGVRVGSVRRATRSRFRFRRAFQMFLRSLWYPVRTLSRQRALIFSLVRRDIEGRYRGSMAGALWTLLHPLLLMIAYYFVFGVVLKVRFPAAAGSGDFVFYFLCGMLPWLAFSEAVGRSPNIILEHSNFVKRVVFPLEILPFNLTLAGLVTEAFGLLIFLAACVTLGQGIPAAALYFPLVLVPQILLTAGLAWFLAALGVFLRDIGQLMGFLLTIWFFMTPICYPPTALPAGWLWLLEKNPMYTIVSAYRAVLLENSPPAWGPLAVLWAVSLGVFWFGHSWFYKVKKSFADLL